MSPDDDLLSDLQLQDVGAVIYVVSNIMKE